MLTGLRCGGGRGGEFRKRKSYSPAQLSRSADHLIISKVHYLIYHALMLQEYTMPMEVFIEPLEEDLKCIKLTNKSAELVNLGGHKLSCTTEGDH